MTHHDETIESGDAFLSIAVTQGLIDSSEAQRVLDHASEHQVSSADAVLALSLMEASMVEAVQLLCRPRDFAAGYELAAIIGTGASGVIFKARQQQMQRLVALKTIRADTPGKVQTRMQREAEAIARMQHPNIVVAFDSGHAQGRFYIAMEYVAGGTLADYMSRQSPVPEHIAWPIIRQAAAGLAHAKEAGVIHRDVKPSNLLLADPPKGASTPEDVPFVKVADFGLAHDFSDFEDTRLTATGVALGTPAYVAPEQLENTHVDCRADIYGLGATAFHMLSGQIPYAELSPMKALLQKTLGDEKWRDAMPDFVSAPSTQLMRDMTANVEERIGDYDELMDRIDDLTANLTGGGRKRTTRRAKSAGPTVGRRTIVIGLACAGLVALLTALGAWYFRSPTNAGPGPDAPVVENLPWKPNGLPTPLFNGTSVPLPLKPQGTWLPEIAEGGGRVLTGGEKSSLLIPLRTGEPPSDNVRVRLNVLPMSSESAVEFEIVDPTSPNPSNVLSPFRVSPSELRIGGPADKPRFAVINAPNEEGFHRIVLSREGGLISLVVNGEPIASWPINAGRYDLQVRCVAGDAQFSDIDIVALVPPY